MPGKSKRVFTFAGKVNDYWMRLRNGGKRNGKRERRIIT
jgi:hypothetical protein